MRSKKKYENTSAVDLEGEGWQPLCEVDRLDSYYHHCDVFGVRELVLESKKMNVNAKESYPVRRFLYGVSADTLGTVAPDKLASRRIETKKHQLPPISCSRKRGRGPPERPIVSDARGSVLEPDSVVEFADSTRVRLKCPGKWATIRYTMDGTPVSETSPKMLSGHEIFVDRDATLKAATWKRGWLSEEVNIGFRRKQIEEESLSDNESVQDLEQADDDEEPVVEVPVVDDDNDEGVVIADTAATVLPPIVREEEVHLMPPSSSSSLPKLQQEAPKKTRGTNAAAGSQSGGFMPIKV